MKIQGNLKYYNTKEFFRFFIINVFVVFIAVNFLLVINNGNSDNAYPLEMTIVSLIISIPIIILQYPLLNKKENWLFRTLIFYLSMLLFLFILGIVSAWNFKVGSNNGGTWLARFDAGLRLMFFGQLFGGFLGLGIVLIINIMLNDKFFIKKSTGLFKNKTFNEPKINN